MLGERGERERENRRKTKKNKSLARAPLAVVAAFVGGNVDGVILFLICDGIQWDFGSCIYLSEHKDNHGIFFSNNTNLVEEF